MIMIILAVAAYLTIGACYFTFTCEDTNKVANPLYWVYNMIGWGVLMWRHQ